MKTETAKRTPGNVFANGYHIQAQNTIIAHIMKGDRISQEEREANTEFIALSWNLHDELVRQVKFYLQDHKIDVHDGSDGICSRCEEIKEVLSKASK